MNKTKLFSLAAVAGCLLSSGLSAATDHSSQGKSMDQCRQCPPNPCPPDPCCEPNPCCPTTPAYGYDVPCEFGILWGAGPRVCEGTDLFVTADFIWWTAREDGLAYAYSGVNGTVGSTNQNGGSGSVQHPDFGWDPGFKVGLGYNLPHDDWDVYAQYTWLHMQGDKDSTSNPVGTTNQLSAIWGISNDNAYPLVDRATGRWDLHFNVIDLEIGRNYFVSQYLTIRPFAGFKGTWQHQDYKVRYTRNTVENDEDVRFVNRMRQDQDMWAIGIRSGFNFAWHFVRDFSLFGDMALSAMMTKYDIDRRDREEQYTLDDSGNIVDRVYGITTLNTNNDFYSLKGVLEMDIGLRYDVWFGCNDAYHLRLQAAWEEQLWWGQNNMIGRFEECAHGDLMLHGLTIKARFDF